MENNLLEAVPTSEVVQNINLKEKVVSMVIRASFDEKLCFQTYLPHKLSEVEASN